MRGSTRPGSVRYGSMLRLAVALVLCIGGSGMVLSAAMSIAAPPAAAQEVESEGALEQRTSDLASGLRCPVCQGLSIEDSPTELAREMRAIVREQLAAGRTPDEVRQYFVAKYGEWILLEPKPTGFNLIVYVLPWLAVVAGLAVIGLAVRRWTRPLPADETAEAPSAAPTIDS